MYPSNENNQTSTPDATVFRPPLQISQLISENENDQILTPESVNSEIPFLNQSQLRNENENENNRIATSDNVISEALLRTPVTRISNAIVESVASSSSSNTIYSETRSSQLDLLVYNAIITDDVQTLAKILDEYPDYDLNRFINPSNSENTDRIKDSGKTPLMIAASLDCKNTVNYLLKSNVEIDLQDESGETALFQAAAAGNADVVKTLLKNDASVDLSNISNVSPLMIAAYHGHSYACRMLLDRGRANINQKDTTEKTAIAYAAHNGHGLAVETLLMRGANINIVDMYHWSPLMLAAYKGRANIVRQLLIAGADNALKTVNGKTAAQLALDGGYLHVSDMIENFIMPEPINSRESKVLSDSILEKGTFNRKSIQISAQFSPRKSHFSINNSRQIRTSLKLIAEMSPREENTWWVYLSWILSFMVLDKFLIKFGGMDSPQLRQAWREKFALCVVVAFASVGAALLTFGFIAIGCTESPPIPNNLINEFWGNSTNSNSNENLVMTIRGKIYKTGGFFKSGFHRPILPETDDSLSTIINPLFGKDISQFFPLDNDAIGCRFRPANAGSNLCPLLPNDSKYHCHTSKNSMRTLESLSINNYVGFSWDEIKSSSSGKKLLVNNNFVYDFTSYLDPSNTDYWLGDDKNFTRTWIENLIGRDATLEIADTDLHDDVVKCFDNFLIGKVEGIPYGCALTKLLVVVLTSVTTFYVLLKLLSAFVYDIYLSRKLGKPKPMSQQESPKYMIVTVPCYSEGRESLKASFDSLAATDYSDQHKLFFIVADGNITGSGETESTPDILKSLIVPLDNTIPKPASYIAIGQGAKRHNMAQVYSGYYHYENRRIPTILVIKCGTPAEKNLPKAGNRGKRDTQLILMNLLKHAFHNTAMCELEFEMFEKIRKLTGVTVDQYQIVCMVDADTIVEEKSISRLVECINQEPTIVGICGETKVMNKTENWVTMIQVFEYYISHHLGKTFESIFACVTCLPGCFCMYQVYSYNDEGYKIPLLIDDAIMTNYTVNEVDTLHQKNLFLLGEDRYLTTLTLRAFPNLKTMYCSGAVCKTIVPNSFSVLVSQRRRWINGTIHNLFELVVSSELPGRFCFSMQCASFLDLFGTLTSPFAIMFTVYLVIGLIFGQPYGLQVGNAVATYLATLFLIVIAGYKPINVLWFLVYLSSVPVWTVILPLYSFWNFDGADTGHDSDQTFDKFDPRKIVFKRWDEWILYRSYKKLPQLAPLHGKYLNPLPITNE
ncbi:9339_t:CDS:2 [Dentiscutata heterogama]|uniref:9339_t:CDS:1 n=1 Tax=Dentiscutata heterogama TaxID=1316150 RepID=A0ACA9L5P3_9GLOM|nr:9339_t:CDS:2 [Dentiscutata heterogama]